MNPFFFGSSEASLYGVYHPAAGTSRNAAVVLCYPFGQEAMRCHRAYRQLAYLLTQKGFHVLRFDYRGTGDSSGEMENTSAEDWLQDINTAIDELVGMTGVRDVSVVGLRLGAVAAERACATRSDIARLVMWDPLLSGAAYLQELTAVIGEGKTGNFIDESGVLNVNGFPLPLVFQAGLRQWDLTTSAGVDGRATLLVVSHETDEFFSLRDHFSTQSGFRYLLAPAPHDWNYVDLFGGILLPQPVIQAIVNWLDRETP